MFEFLSRKRSENTQTVSNQQPEFVAQNSLATQKNNSIKSINHNVSACACGGSCPACRAKSDAPEISQPHDLAEIEADKIADNLMHLSTSTKQNDHAAHAPQKSRRNLESGNVQPQALQLKALSDSSQAHSAGIPAHVQSVLSSGGRPLEKESRPFFEFGLGFDLSSVRIHTDSKAHSSASAINARAYAYGKHIVFGRGEYNPHSASGKHLLAHELAHVTQPGNTIRRQIHPQDVSGQMVGQLMTVTSNFTAPAFTVRAGDTVEILAWSNASDTANVRLPAGHASGGIPFDIPKILLRPIAATAGLDQYSSGIDSVVRSIAAGDARIAQERARTGGPRPGEIPRLEGLQRNRRSTLNIRLIQQTMFNRFDSSIVNWVSFYNAQFAASRFGNLDANLVKAMLFQESELGTSGSFMSLTPANREMGIHNLGQVIDSSASALLIMMREMEPALLTQYHLQTIAHDTASRPAGIGAEDFMWSYVAAGQTQGFQDAVTDFYATAGGGMRDTDYDFWIRTAVRWLFEKRGSVSSWAEAIRAYNGSGTRARHYRDTVRGRAADAATATAGGTEFIPHR